MLDEKKFIINKSGQVFPREKMNKALTLQRKVIKLFEETFDNDDDFEYVNLALAFIHSSKLREYLSGGLLHEGAITKLLIDHLYNTELLVEETEFREFRKS